MDTVDPTPELLKHRPDYEEPKLSREKDRAAYKLNTVIDRLFRNGDITHSEFEAVERFYKHYTKGMHSPGLVPAYGERMGGSTPLSQLSTGTLTAAERRTHHHTAAVSALQAIHHPEQCAMIMKCVIDDMPLQKASVEVFGGRRDCAAAAGKYAIICAVRTLAHHFDQKYTK